MTLILVRKCVITTLQYLESIPHRVRLFCHFTYEPSPELSPPPLPLLPTPLPLLILEDPLRTVRGGYNGHEDVTDLFKMWAGC